MYVSEATNSWIWACFYMKKSIFEKKHGKNALFMDTSSAFFRLFHGHFFFTCKKLKISKFHESLFFTRKKKQTGTRLIELDGTLFTVKFILNTLPPN